MSITFTVVTVTYNAEKSIRKTVESIISQTINDFEYIIIDGNSHDKTLKIVDGYLKDFKSKNIPTKIISEPDSGIYDAMNKGIKLAEGKWIIFMNAGDQFYSENVLEKTKKTILNEVNEKDMIIYGDTVIEDNNYYRKIKPKRIEEMVQILPFNHQSTFVKTELMKKTLFDTSYKIAGDYNLFLGFYLKKMQFHYIPVTISLFAYGGASQVNPKNTLLEYQRVREKNGLCKKRSDSFYMDREKVIAFIWLRKIVIALFPKLVYTRKKGWYDNKFCK